MTANFPDTSRGEACLPGFYIVNCDDVADLISKQNVCPDAAEFTVLRFDALSETMFDIGEADTAQPFEPDSRSKGDMNGCPIYLRSPLGNEVHRFHRSPQRIAERFRGVVNCGNTG
jgi:hypothetical protein